MDWATIRQDLFEELGAPTSDKTIDRVLAQSLRWHRNVQTFFNESETTVTTVTDQEKYDLPSDFVARVGTVYYQHAGSTTRLPMNARTWEWMEGYRNRFGADEFSNMIHGYPRIYAIKAKPDYDGVSEIFVGPTPAVAGDTINIRYTKDLGTPTWGYTSNGWQVTDPATSQGVASSFTNEWLDEGYEVIRSYAKYLWQTKYGKDADEAQAGREEHAMFLADLKRRTSKDRRPDGPRPWLTTYG